MSVLRARRPLSSDYREKCVCVVRGNGKEWEMVMKELIASSGFQNRTRAPRARARQHANGILMTMAKIRENDPAV